MSAFIVGASMGKKKAPFIGTYLMILYCRLLVNIMTSLAI